MRAQHYCGTFYGSRVVYPQSHIGSESGVLADTSPTLYPPYMDQYFDSYYYGHVRAHLVQDPVDGVIVATDGYKPLIVGGRCVCNAWDESISAFASDHGYIIFDIGSGSYRFVYIGGQYDTWHLRAISGKVTLLLGSMRYTISDVHSLFLGDASDAANSPYWWFTPNEDGHGYSHQFANWCSSFDSMFADVVRDGDSVDQQGYPFDPYNGKTDTFSLTGECVVSKPTYEFVPHGAENDWLELALSFGQPDGHRVHRYLADSYIAAAQELPVASANTLQNMLELGSLISKLVHGNFSSLKDFTNLKNLWLGYRYSYNTTKLDISDYRSVTSRLLALDGIPTITTHGSVTYDEYRVRTSIEVKAEEVIPHDASSFFKVFNAKISLVNTWDAIPWSFVVDWFLHVGDVLERLEACASAYNLNPVSCWSSIERLGGKFYLRFPYAYSGGASVFQDFRCSGKTFIMRIADAICLFSR